MLSDYRGQPYERPLRVGGSVGRPTHSDETETGQWLQGFHPGTCGATNPGGSSALSATPTRGISGAGRVPDREEDMLNRTKEGGLTMLRGLFALALLSGCAPALTVQGARVLAVKTMQDIATCKDLGHVSASFGNGWSVGEDMSGALLNAKNEAGRMGGTHLLITHHAMGDWAANVEGAAYLCAPGQGGRQAVELVGGGQGTGAKTSGCARDTDCKGERVCEDGRCVDPAKK